MRPHTELGRRIRRGDYVVDSGAVADALLSRRAAAVRHERKSEVLVPAEIYEPSTRVAKLHSPAISNLS